MDAELARLMDVDVTKAWAHESLRFTPWLSKHIDQLADALGFPLEFVGNEVAVGKYKADILATNPIDGSHVLIENQLRESDHGHIGQILTYLAGLKAKTIIWIAPQFRDEHRSAIRWLNQHTQDDIAFFAVQLRVVQIADSRLAPLFDVLEQPSNWDRGLQKLASETIPAERGWRKDFWAQYLKKYPNAAEDRAAGGYGSSRWRRVPGSELIVARWVGEKAVGVFVRGDRGVRTPEIFNTLMDDREQLEQRLGAKIGMDEWYPFMTQFECDVSDPAKADAAIDWLETRTRQFVGALEQYAKGID